MATETINQPSFSDELAEYVSGLSFEDVPPEAVRLAERCFVDTTGVTLGGAIEGAGAIAAVTVPDGDGPDSVALLGNGECASMTDAAYVNGTPSTVTTSTMSPTGCAATRA